MTTEVSSIRSLRPNVTREEAIQAFTAAGPASLYWRLRIGSLQRIADAYIPFRIYKVRYAAGGGRHTHHFALDAVDGSLDLFEFAKPPGDAETFTVATRNHPPPSLSEALSENLLRDKVLRLIFQRGFSRCAMYSWKQNNCRERFTSHTGWDSTARRKICVAARWMRYGDESREQEPRPCSSTGSLPDRSRQLPFETQVPED